MSNRSKIYEIRADHRLGGWKVVSSGTTLKRTATKREAVEAGQLRARNRATDTSFGSNAILRIRRIDGSVSEERNYYFRTEF